MRSLALSPQRATIRWSWSMTLRTEDCRCPEWKYGAPRGVRGICSRGQCWPHRTRITRLQSALVLNDDAVLEEGALETLCAEWTEADEAIAPVLDEPHGLVYGIHVSRWGRVRLAMHPGPVQALSGAALLLRSTERFDEQYRHGFEDIELCRRLTQRGLRVRVIERARCAHAAGATVGRQTPEATRAGIDGHLRYVGGGAAGVVAVGLAVAQVCIEGPRISRMRGLAQGVGDYLKGRQPERGPSPS